MLKIGLVILLFAIELYVYYSFGGFASYPFRILGYGFLLFGYYSKKKYTLNFTDRLFIAASFFPIFSPLPVYVLGFALGKTLELALIMIGYLFIIRIFQVEGSKIILADKQNTFLNIFIPYVVMPCAFFIAVILPLTSATTIILTGVYLLLMLYMVVLSAFVPFTEKSKLYISLAMFFVVLASGANAYRMYISHFPFDYGVVRIVTNLFRIFFMLGILYRVDQRVSYSVLSQKR
ncbi:hypothetical protein [Emticicia sp. SJ17W-69]|uniref:hypothetical protein n=1 Tax=Emticicia sp. SJ17W-69 TaxID=3421657 RepID=UPI003EBE17B1